MSVKCGIVLGQEYVHDKIYEQNSTYTIKIEKKLDLYGSIYNILDKLNINDSSYPEKIYDLIARYLSDFKCENEIKVGLQFSMHSH